MIAAIVYFRLVNAHHDITQSEKEKDMGSRWLTHLFMFLS